MGMLLLFCPDPEDRDCQEVVCFPKAVLYIATEATNYHNSFHKPNGC